MPRKQHKYHFIYKTTNLKNNKFYIGMHSTSNLEDGYLGSGKRLWNSINYYGRENFKIEILEYFETREELAKRERELVNEDLLKDQMCMNLALGGSGGNIFLSVEQRKKFHSSGGRAVRLMFCKIHHEKMKNDVEYYENVVSKIRGNKNWLGKKHKPETIEKMKQSKIGHGIGEKNSQFGTCWITDGIQNKIIKKDNTIPNGWKLGRIQNKKNI